MLCRGQNGGLMWGKVVKSGSDNRVLYVWGDYPPSKARNTFSFFSSNVITKPPYVITKHKYCYIYDHGTDGTKIKKTCEECYSGAGW